MDTINNWIGEVRIAIVSLWLALCGVTIYAGLAWGFHWWHEATAQRVLCMAFAGVVTCITGEWLADRFAWERHERSRRQRGFEIKRRNDEA